LHLSTAYKSASKRKAFKLAEVVLNFKVVRTVEREFSTQNEASVLPKITALYILV
jgi:hypothetical protein